jgi:hypothetical protein
MQLLPHEVAIGILADEFADGTFPDPGIAFSGKAEARRFLCELTGTDLGEDAEGWKAWFAGCDGEFIGRSYCGWAKRWFENQVTLNRQSPA